jgi:hypothetical protein
MLLLLSYQRAVEAKTPQRPARHMLQNMLHSRRLTNTAAAATTLLLVAFA